jgi:hypothetical protein
MDKIFHTGNYSRTIFNKKKNNADKNAMYAFIYCLNFVPCLFFT